jgi:chromosome segregation ATPase
MVQITPLATRDIYLQQIEEQIKAKEALLLKKDRYLRDSVKQNEHLKGVQEDYKRYKDHVIREKRALLQALQVLQEHTASLKASTQLIEGGIRQAKKDQGDILREIGKIKEELNALTTFT